MLIFFIICFSKQQTTVDRPPSFLLCLTPPGNTHTTPMTNRIHLYKSANEIHLTATSLLISWDLKQKRLNLVTESTCHFMYYYACVITKFKQNFANNLEGYVN